MATIHLDDFLVNPNGNGIMLLPEKTSCTVTVGVTYLADGHWDITDFMTKLENGVMDKMGLKVDFRSEAKPGSEFLGRVQRGIIKDGIQAISDPLEDFEISPGNSGGGSGVSLILKGTNIRTSLACGVGADGQLDISDLAPAVERCYQERFYWEAELKALSDAQRNWVLKKGTQWLAGLLVKLEVWTMPEAVLNTENGSWSGNSLQLWVSTPGKTYRVYKLLIPVNEQGNADYRNIDVIAQKIAKERQKENIYPPEYMVYANLSASLGEAVKDYVEWIVDQERKIQQQAWDAINCELDKNLKEAEELEVALAKLRADTLRNAGNLVDIKMQSSGTGANGPRQVQASPSKQNDALAERWSDLEKWLNSFPGRRSNVTGPPMEEMGKGLNFAIRAVGVILEETTILVLADAASAVKDALAPYLFGKLIAKAVKIVGALQKVYKYYKKGEEFASIINSIFTKDETVKEIMKTTISKAQRIKIKLDKLSAEILHNKNKVHYEYDRGY